MHRLIGLALVASLSVAARTAVAADLSAALELERSGRLREALESFEQVLATPGSTREDLATIHLHLGLLRFAAGDSDGARQELAPLLAVEPEASLPESAPPEIQALLGEALRLWGGRRLHAQAEVQPRHTADDPVLVAVAVVDDVVGIVGGAAVLVGDEVVAQASGRGPFVLEVAPEAVEGRSEPVTVELRDEHGGQVWSGATLEITAAPPRGEDRSARDRATIGPGGSDRRVRDMRIAGWTLLAAGLVAAAAGGSLIGVDGMATGATREDGDLRQREVLDTASGGWALLAGGASVLVVGIVLLAVRPRREPAEESALRVAAGVVAQW